MTKIISLLILALFIANTQFVLAKTTNNAETKANQVKTIAEEDYDFENNSFYISDEQLQQVEEMNEPEEKTTLDVKIINSSHFSSGTATKTYIPINKNK